MAPISSLEASSSTSNPHSYDVFLNFRGEDTRKTFTGHLYANLVAHGIHTFKDDEELEKGRDILTELLRAIKESSIFIIIFSRNYATSKWCLNELVTIIDCMTKREIEVIPVFYHVEPSDVRNQGGSFQDAFLGHAKDADEEKKRMIEKWKIVLEKAANKSGHHVDDQKEADIIRNIRLDVIKKLNRQPLDVGDNIVGMDVHLKQLKSLIKTELDEVRMIGIYGIGGIGKTTIAMAIYNDISSQFDGCVFLKNIGGKDEGGILELQKDLLQHILKCERPEFNSTNMGNTMLERRLCTKRVLIVLDDVDDREQLTNLAGQRKWYGAKSRIIITTKDTHLLTEHGVDEVYEVKELNHEQATELFNWCAFKHNIPKFDEGYEKLSHSVIKYAKGLPIALKVLGGFLFGRTKLEWESALTKLKRTPFKDVQKVLRVSYDRLDYTAKGIFLDIACFFKGEDKDFVSRIIGEIAENELKVLSERCLITISENKLHMHDLLQQMGHEIIRRRYSEDPERGSRLWDSSDVDDVLTRNEAIEKIEGLFIDMSTSSWIKFTTTVFERMNGLRLLKVYNWHGNKVAVPTDFEFPSRKLRYLYWDGYPLGSLPENFDAPKLVQLDLMYSSIKHLWQRDKKLDKLKIINVSYSKNLIELPDFSSMPNLESLILEGCICLECLPRNFHELKLLQSLSCDGCSKLKSFPEIERNMRNLRELNLSKTAVTELPSSIGHLHGLKDLNLSYCKDLAILPEGICSLSSLKNLDLRSTAIVELPSSIGHLKALKHLDLSRCENLVSLPESICYLSSLETLCLLECSRLKHFPEIKGDMKNMKTRDLQSTTIEELPSSIGSLHALERLDLSGCKNLGNLPESICNLSSLKTLDLHGCSGLRTFPEINDNMKNLTTLDLKSTGIEKLPSSIGRLHALEHLYLSGCKDLVDLPESICNLSSLKTLHVRDCSQLHGSKLDLQGLQCLEDLELSYISCEWGCLSGLCSLRSLHLSCCNLKEGLMQRNDFSSTLKRFDVTDRNHMEGGIPNDIRHPIKFPTEQNYPPNVEGSSSHQKFGHHGSAEGDTNDNSHIKRNLTEHSPAEEPHHKRFRGIHD